MRYFNVLLIWGRGKGGIEREGEHAVTHELQLFSEKGEPKRNRTEALLLALLLSCCFTSTKTSCKGRGAQDGHLDFHTAPVNPVLFVYHCTSPEKRAGHRAEGACPKAVASLLC